MLPKFIYSLLLKVSVVAADITISGKLFQTLTILGEKKIFLNHSDIYYLLILGYDGDH